MRSCVLFLSHAPTASEQAEEFSNWIACCLNLVQISIVLRGFIILTMIMP